MRPTIEAFVSSSTAGQPDLALIVGDLASRAATGALVAGALLLVTALLAAIFLPRFEPTPSLQGQGAERPALYAKADEQAAVNWCERRLELTPATVRVGFSVDRAETPDAPMLTVRADPAQQYQGLTPTDLQALASLRERVRAGLVSEDTVAAQRLAFARWLAEQGRLSS